MPTYMFKRTVEEANETIEKINKAKKKKHAKKKAMNDMLEDVNRLKPFKAFPHISSYFSVSC